MNTSLLTIVLLIVNIAFATAQNKIDDTFFDKADQFFQANVKSGKIDYANLKAPEILSDLILVIEQADLSQAEDAAKKAFYINAYNLLVINEVLKKYPIVSVQEVSGFFDKKKIKIARKNLTINELEKEKLLNVYKDARLHFVLVCAALDCPPLADFAYRPNLLEAQLEQQTRKTLNNPRFIRVSGERLGLSEIFRWYSYDFGNGKRSILQFINRFRTEAVSEDSKVYYYPYDWSLNSPMKQNGIAASNNSKRYVISMAVPKGTTETKIFNNLYTQRSERDENNNLTERASYFTSWWSFLYGVNDRFNLGFDLRYRRVNNTQLPSSPLDVFDFSVGKNRSALSNFGPKIRWAPTERLPNFSVQSAFWFPLDANLEGTSDYPYLDWDSYIWWTQFFNDVSIGSSFSLFTEVDFLWEDIGSNQNNRISTPATAIFSYFPHPQVTLYGLANVSPYWYKNLDIFAQAGVGAKYQFNPQLELELLYTVFTNAFLFDSNGRAGTYNIGLRFNR